MKTITTFECDVCGNTDADEQIITNCEKIPMLRASVAIGDIVIVNSNAYGWWRDENDQFTKGDNVDQDWFLLERGDPNSKSHLVRAQLGFPKYVVLAIVNYRDIYTPGDARFYGKMGHREVALLYSPGFANSGTRTRYCWAPADYQFRVVGQLDDEQLEKFQAAVANKAPSLI